MKLTAFAPRSLGEVGPTFKRLFLVFFLFSIFYFLFSISPVSAQTNSPYKQANPFTAPNTNPDVPKNLHTYTQNVVIEILSAATCQLSGIDPTNPNQPCLGVDQETGKIGFIPSSNGGGGAIGVMGKMISMLYTPPLHTGDYFGHLAQNFGIAKPAHAQGTGFEGLKPLLGLWTAFRNIVYLIFTIVFVVIGLAIMFRIKIDPRTVMTIQNQIPKIIVGIVLVTFSYAIAGFLIDIMYGSIYLIGNIMTSASKQSPAVVTGVVQSENPFSAATQTVGLVNVAWKPAQTVGNFIEPIFDNEPGKIITGIIGYIVGTQAEKIVKTGENAAKGVIKGITTFFGFIAGTAATGGNPAAGAGAAKITNVLVSQLLGIGTGVASYFFAKNAAEFVVMGLAFLIIVIAILWALFRLWFVLIMAYIYILIDVVLAPFWIAGGLIPGIPINFTGWLRHIFAKIAAFPTTIALFLLGKVFIDVFGTTQTAGQFVPPLIGNPTSTNALGAIIGLGTILLIPNVVKMTDRMFGAPKIDLSGIAQAIGVGAGAPIRLGRLGFSEATHKLNEAGLLVYKQGPLAKIGRLLGL